MRALPLAFLVAALILAGCVGSSAPAPQAATPAPTPATPAPVPHASPAAPPPSVPSGFFVTDGGQVQGPFDRSWPLKVAAVGFRDALVEFNLSGVQEGVPPTARVHLSLQDAAGREIKGEDVGLGASPTLHWSLGARELPLPGTYTLKATSAQAQGAPIPSGGAASYHLFAAVTY